MKKTRNTLAFAVALCCGSLASASSMAASCSVSSNVWSNGYTLTVTVDSETAAVDSWQAQLKFAQTPDITNSWNAEIQSSGKTVTASSLDWNSHIEAGNNVTFGLQGSYDGSFTAPDCVLASSGSSSSGNDTGNTGGDSSDSSATVLSQDGNPVHQRYKSQRTEWSQSKADIVLSYQYDNGGWPKNQKYDSKGSGGSGKGTFDNGATTTEMIYLAQVYRDGKNTKYRDAVRKGMDYTLEAQYSSGGWPQFYPLKGGYHDHVTYNDNAMSSVLTMLYHASRKDAPFDTDIFSDSDREKMKKAITKGVEYILKSQWKQNGQLTVWCAQHGKDDYQPKKARAYELKSLSGSESVEVLGFLMTQPQTDEVKKAVKAGLAWFSSPNTYLADHTYDKSVEEKIVYKKGSRMWYRFYDLDTNKGFFSDRDGKKYYDLMDISSERRNGYSWGGSYGEKIISYAKKVGYL
ncbi:Endoglucanase E1 precursor [Vibrio aerogenes CECT 7868]|uniref:Endoglucanase E1 n=1 Tax=Vibrio aerogenes CECT 7868 TaxID=1216006 RepID=A0A1M5ZN99_9VIBR|nr:pectate lyase [Vibrio aerogenes]SHI25589.1 Endoglucanase E1 precursor [Vibrio aerogenes CECT 7868]